MIDDGKTKHTFEALPEGARLISEEEGVRNVQLSNGVVLGIFSKEKKEQIRTQKPYTLEQIRSAKPIEVIIPGKPDSTPQVLPPQPDGPPGKFPGRKPKNAKYP